MIELLAGSAAILAVLLIAAVVFAVTYRQERDEALADLETLQEAKDGLALSLHAAAKAHDKAVNTGIIEVTRLSDENVQLKREKGRIEAELRAAKQDLAKFERPRGKGGRFAKKAPKPIACG